MNTQKNKKSGFTLVELMVVAIIVAILAAVAIPLMSGNKDRAMASEAESAIGTLMTAGRVYLAEHDRYPASKADITSITANDLNGQFFSYADYSYSGTSSNTYDIAAVGALTSGKGDGLGKAAGLSVSIDETGVWVRNY